MDEKITNNIVALFNKLKISIDGESLILGRNTNIIVKNGLLITNACANILGLILYFFASSLYLCIAWFILKVFDLDNFFGQIEYLEFFGFKLFKYFPLNLPPASGEYAKSPQFSLIDTSELAISYVLLIKL